MLKFNSMAQSRSLIGRARKLTFKFDGFIFVVLSTLVSMTSEDGVGPVWLPHETEDDRRFDLYDFDGSLITRPGYDLWYLTTRGFSTCKV